MQFKMRLKCRFVGGLFDMVLTAVGLYLVISVISCSKEANLTGASSLVIVNAVPGSHNFVTNFTGSVSEKNAQNFQWFNSALQIPYGGSSEVSAYSGDVLLSVSPISDTLNAFWSGHINLPLNSMHSLFFVGADSLHVDTVFSTDTPPYHPVTDSSIGLRFANLSPGSGPVSVDIKGAVGNLEVPNMPYKRFTDFKNYPATSKISTYTFEFRDLISGLVLSTYTISGANNGGNVNTANNIWRYRNYTIALKGLPGSQSTMIIVNN